LVPIDQHPSNQQRAMVVVHNFQLLLRTANVLASIPVLAQEREDSFHFWDGENLWLAWQEKLQDASKVYLGPSKMTDSTPILAL